MVVAAGDETLVGSQLFTVTAPSSAPVELDINEILQQDVIISDGTGTELKIAAGTKITLPEGSLPEPGLRLS